MEYYKYLVVSFYWAGIKVHFLKEFLITNTFTYMYIVCEIYYNIIIEIMSIYVHTLYIKQNS